MILRWSPSRALVIADLKRPALWTRHSHDVWPWWRLFKISIVRTNKTPPSTGWNVWFYSRRTQMEPMAWDETGVLTLARRGKCIHVAIDRRTAAQRGVA